MMFKNLSSLSVSILADLISKFPDSISHYSSLFLENEIDGQVLSRFRNELELFDFFKKKLFIENKQHQSLVRNLLLLNDSNSFSTSNQSNLPNEEWIFLTNDTRIGSVNFRAKDETVVLFHCNPRQHEGQIVMNTNFSSGWGTEERIRMPIGEGPLTFKVKVTTVGFELFLSESVNEKPSHIYKHRLPWTYFSKFSVTNLTVLTTVSSNVSQSQHLGSEDDSQSIFLMKKVTRHLHPLILIHPSQSEEGREEGQEEEGWYCDGRRQTCGCRSGLKSMIPSYLCRFRCDLCDFDFCLSCVLAWDESTSTTTPCCSRCSFPFKRFQIENDQELTCDHSCHTGKLFFHSKDIFYRCFGGCTSSSCSSSPSTSSLSLSSTSSSSSLSTIPSPSLSMIGSGHNDSKICGKCYQLEETKLVNTISKLPGKSLFYACQDGDSQKIRKLLTEEGVNANQKDSEGKTALMLTSSSEVASILFDIGANIFEKDMYGKTALMYACERGSQELVSYLIGIKAIVNDRDRFGKTPLMYACEKGSTNVISLLIGAGARVNEKDGHDRTALMYACEKGSFEIVSILLGSGASVNERSRIRKTPLMYACEEGSTELFLILLDAGADINETDESWKSPLMYACEKGSPKIVTMLLGAGANKHSKDKFGRTPLMFASERGVCEVVTSLVKRGANVNETDNNGKTPLMYASESGSSSVVSFLMESGAQTNEKDQSIKSAFIYGSESGSVEVVTLLLRAGASVNEKFKSDKTPLMFASEKGSHEVVSFLIGLGAHINEKDLSDKTALMYGSEIGSSRVVSQLISAGANIHGKDKFGKTALILAVEGGFSEVVSLLLTAGARGRERHKDGETSFQYAHQKNFLQLASLLIRNGPSDSDWTLIVQNLKYLEYVKLALKHNHYRDSLCDSTGRPIYELALPEIRKLLDEHTLWFGRFKLLEERPEHQSATCYLFKALDRQGPAGPQRVALKLMANKDQFVREIRMKELDFEADHVIGICSHHPSDLSEETLASLPDRVPVSASSSCTLLPKSYVEGMFAISLPLADRNLFVALKQERFAGKDWNMVKFIFKDLLRAVDHVHSKGIIHADLKPLNIVRVDGDWKLIDFDACCRIGLDHTGLKSSSAFCPPESIYVDRSVSPALASVRSEDHRAANALDYDLLLAHPSFDVWSLGCIFYQMCTDCRMLFQGGQDDNLKADDSSDSLLHLEEWTDGLKAQRLSQVENSLARNLLSLMLMKDPTKRPSLSRIFEHPFLTGKQVSRLIGEKAEFDVFLSYRVWSDAAHVEYLYDNLTSEGLKVWWDKKELKDGENWEAGFCNGLVKSRIFVPFLSQKGLANFSTLDASSRCDNVLLEHRLALELKEMGLIEGIFPIIMGDEVPGSEPTRMKIDWSVIFPTCRDVCVSSVEEGTCHHMHNQALGSPLQPNRSVLSVMTEMKKMQGALIDGEYEAKMNEASARIQHMTQPIPTPSNNIENKLNIRSSSPSSSSSSEDRFSSLLITLTDEVEGQPSERREELIEYLHQQLPLLFKNFQ